MTFGADRKRKLDGPCDMQVVHKRRRLGQGPAKCNRKPLALIGFDMRVELLTNCRVSALTQLRIISSPTGNCL